MRRGAGVSVRAAALLLALAPAAGWAQMLRYSNHREVQPPDYALLRIGPFYSNVEFSQSVGWRYSRSRGAGTDYLSGRQLGAIEEDGTEYPLISVFTTRNYLMLTRRADLDLSVSAVYAYYPRDTQESGWQVFFPEEGVSAGLSSEFMLTPFVRGTVYDNMLYRTDYVDTRGLNDYYGGEKYVYFNNVAGVNVDWLMAADQNLALSFSREDMQPRSAAFEDQERVSYREGAMYQYQLFAGLVFGAGAAFVQHRYASTGRVDVSQEDYFVNLGFARDVAGGFRVTRATTGTVKLGYARAAAAARSVTSGEDGVESAGSDTAQSEALSAEVRLETEVSKEVRQTIVFSKGLRNGFESPVERYEQWRYQLAWQRHQTSASAWTSFAGADPEGGLTSRYRDWTSGVNFSAEIVRGVAFVASSTYADRINSGVEDGDLPIESTADYATWTSTAGIRVPVTKSIGFSADYAHVERISGERDLAYVRDAGVRCVVRRERGQPDNEQWEKDGDGVSQTVSRFWDARSLLVAGVPRGVRLVLGAWRDARRLRDLLKQYELDLVHVNVHGYEAACLACRLAEIPIVAMCLNYPVDGWDAARRFLRRSLLRATDHVTSQSAASSRAWAQVADLERWRVSHIWNSADERLLELPREAWQPWRQLRLLATGRIHWMKGYDRLIEAMAMVKVLDVHLLIAGEGQDREPLRSMVQRLGLADRVDLPGYVPDITDLLRNSDVYAMPSVALESGPASLAEAMMAGLPCITSDFGPLAEMNVNGVTGLVVPAGDSAGLAGAIRRLAGDPAAMAAMSGAARYRARMWFTRGDMIARHLRLYSAVLGMARQGRET